MDTAGFTLLVVSTAWESRTLELFDSGFCLKSLFEQYNTKQLIYYLITLKAQHMLLQWGKMF